MKDLFLAASLIAICNLQNANAQIEMTLSAPASTSTADTAYLSSSNTFSAAQTFKSSVTASAFYGSYLSVGQALVSGPSGNVVINDTTGSDPFLRFQVNGDNVGLIETTAANFLVSDTKAGGSLILRSGGSNSSGILLDSNNNATFLSGVVASSLTISNQSTFIGSVTVASTAIIGARSNPQTNGAASVFQSTSGPGGNLISQWLDNGGAGRMAISDSGLLVIGSTSTNFGTSNPISDATNSVIITSAPNKTARLAIIGDGSLPIFQIRGFGNAGTQIFDRYGGTLLSSSAVAASSVLGTFQYKAFDGNALQTLGQLSVVVDASGVKAAGAVGGAIIPTSIQLQTASALSAVTHAILTSTGNLVVNTGTAATENCSTCTLHAQGSGSGIVSDGSMTQKLITTCTTGTQTDADGKFSACVASDRRLKIPQGNMWPLGGIEKLKPVDYRWKNPLDRGYGNKGGFYAQDVEKVWPECVVPAGAYKGIDPLCMLGHYALEIQELRNRVKELEAKK